MSYGISIILKQPFEGVVTAVRDALATQGFGVLTEIDVQATMKAKLGEDLEPYLILGVCNPAMAMRALNVDPSLGLLLPCNVVVRQCGADTIVEAIDPQTMVSVTDNPALQPVADEVAGMLTTALAALTT
jgi:uncharacterized protein (DUF302 family)